MSDISVLEFAKYREMAPAVVSDERIVGIMRASAGDVAGITKAIENLWHDIPDSRAVNPGSEWDITAVEKRKIKKKVEVSADPVGKHRNKENKDYAKDRDPSRESRADKGPAGFVKVAKQAPKAAAPAATQHKPAAAPAAVTPASISTPSASVASQWTSTAMTFAEKLKQAELAKAAAIEKSANDQNVSRRDTL
jgi:hypothetical protein